jgi:plastocyanin
MTYRILRRGLVLAAIVTVLSATVAARAADPGAAAPSAAVTISNFAFDPPSLTVAPGTKVVWTNLDEEPHLVAGASKEAPFKSPALDTNDTFAFVFEKPGVYKYYCQIHPHMLGQITVK